MDFWSIHLRPLFIPELYSVQRLHIQLVCGQRRQILGCDFTTKLSVTHERKQSQANYRSVLVLRAATSRLRHVRHACFQGKRRQLFDLGFAIWVLCFCTCNSLYSTGIFSRIREYEGVSHCACSYDQNTRARDIAGSCFDVYGERAESRRRT